MAVYNSIGDTIEGEAVDFDGRAIYPQGAKKHPLTKKTMKLYTTDKNSHAIVRKEGVEPTDETLKEATNHYHRKVGDRLTADALSVYTDLRAKYHQETIHGEGASSQHGTNFASVKGYTIASVKMPLYNLLKKLGMSNNTLTIENNAD